MQNHLRQSFEANLHRNRALEMRRSSLVNALRDQAVCDGHGRSENRVNELRLKNQRMEVDKEIERGEKLEMEAFIKSSRDAMVASTIRQDAITAARTSEEARDEQVRQRVIAESAELKLLRSRLQNAALNRERAAQILEKHHREEARLREEWELEQGAARERAKQDMLEARERLDRVAKRESAKLTQLRQMTERDSLKARESLAFQEEKRQADALSAAAAEEERRLKVEQMRKDETTRLELQKFMEEETFRKQQLKEAEMEDERRASNHQRMQQERKAALASAQQARTNARLEASAAVASQISAAQIKQNEIESLINDLHREEACVKQREDAKRQALLQSCHKAEMMRHHEAFLRRKEDEVRERKFEEARVRESLIADFERDEKLHQLSEQRKREKVLRFNRELADLIALKRTEFTSHAESELARIQKERETLRASQNLIDEEKDRMLKTFNDSIQPVI